MFGPLALISAMPCTSAGGESQAVQVPPSGAPIALMADHQTTGGYPRIAHVVSAHLPKLAQLRPSDCIQFKMMDNGSAEELLVAQQKELHILQRACMDHLNEMVC